MPAKLLDPTTSDTALCAIGDQLIDEHLKRVFVDDTTVWRLGQTYSRQGYVKLRDLVPQELKDMLRAEVDALIGAHSVRREIRIKETGNTKRFMRNVSQPKIAAHGRLIPAIYQSNALKTFLGRLANDELIGTPWREEEYIITRQEKAGDTHGWHWGDYSHTLIWVLEAPSLDAGGMLQCVPHTVWDKANPRVHEHLVDNPISTYALESGDIYFLKSDTTLHRTVPLVKDCVRIILNHCWASATKAQKEVAHETMAQLFAE